MSCTKPIYRVDGDVGPPITVEHEEIDVTGWTITARFKKPSGERYTITATITATGDGADVSAEYNFAFTAGQLTKGNHEFDFHYSHASIADFSIPEKGKLTMVVRDG
jgi:hypothetical protein